MHTHHWAACEDLNDVMAEIDRLGLAQNVVDLDAYGFTVIEDLLDDETLTEARQSILDICAEQTGVKPDIDTGETHPDWRLVPYLMPRRPVFQDILLNERGVALIHYLLGKSAQLSSMTCHFKGPGDGGQLPLHTDTNMPAPLPPYSQVANINYALTDYSKEGGCLALVPGSHKWARGPEPTEALLAGPAENKLAEAMEVPAGTGIIWHGNLWHGSYPRKTPGLRINLAVYHARPHWKLQERYGRELPQDVVDRHGNNPLFRQLAGLNEVYGWKEEGPAFLDQKNGGYRAGTENVLRDSSKSWQS